VRAGGGLRREAGSGGGEIGAIFSAEEVFRGGEAMEQAIPAGFSLAFQGSQRGRILFVSTIGVDLSLGSHISDSALIVGGGGGDSVGHGLEDVERMGNLFWQRVRPATAPLRGAHRDG
jgi:hypothetical protein